MTTDPTSPASAAHLAAAPLSDDEIDLVTEPLRTAVAFAADRTTVITAPLVDVVDQIGKACETILVQRLHLIEHRLDTLRARLAAVVGEHDEQTHTSHHDEDDVRGCPRCIVDAVAAITAES